MAYRDQYEPNPFAAPDSDLAPEHSEGFGRGIVYATFWQRWVASVVDGFIIVLISVGVSLSAVMIFGLNKHAANDSELDLVPLLLQLGLQCFQWLYFALQESSEAGATPGKKMVGLRVVSLSGEQISFLGATGRYFGKIISSCLLLIGFLMQPFTAKRQALHDIMAGTLVIQD